MRKLAVKHCPNCGGTNTEQLPGDRLLCIDCNVTYKIELDGSAKPVDTDPLGKIIDKVHAKIKAEQQPKVPAAPGQPSTPVDLQPEDQEEDDDI